MTKLDGQELDKVSGGGTDITTYEDARSIALQLGPEEGSAFLTEWGKFHQDLYNEHRKEIENLFVHQEFLCKE